MAKTLNLVVGRIDVFVGNENDADLETRFEFGDVGALFIEKEARNLHRHLDMHGCCVFFHRLFLKDAQNVQAA